MSKEIIERIERQLNHGYIDLNDDYDNEEMKYIRKAIKAQKRIDNVPQTSDTSKMYDRNWNKKEDTHDCHQEKCLYDIDWNNMILFIKFPNKESWMKQLDYWDDKDKNSVLYYCPYGKFYGCEFKGEVQNPLKDEYMILLNFEDCVLNDCK